MRCVQDGRFPIDNNDCENAIRPFVIGIRNRLFANTQAGTNAAADQYALLQTCLVNDFDIDRNQHFAALPVALPTVKTVEDFEAWLPWQFEPTCDRSSRWGRRNDVVDRTLSSRRRPTRERGID